MSENEVITLKSGWVVYWINTHADDAERIITVWPRQWGPARVKEHIHTLALALLGDAEDSMSFIRGNYQKDFQPYYIAQDDLNSTSVSIGHNPFLTARLGTDIRLFNCGGIQKLSWKDWDIIERDLDGNIISKKLGRNREAPVGLAI